MHRRAQSPQWSSPTKRSVPMEQETPQKRRRNPRTYVLRYRWNHIVDFWFQRYHWTDPIGQHWWRCLKLLLQLRCRARFILCFLPCFLFLWTSSRLHSKRHRQLPVPVVFSRPILPKDDPNDTHRRRFFLPKIHPYNLAPNYDGLHLTFLPGDGMTRVIHSHSSLVHEDQGHVYTNLDFRNRTVSGRNDDSIEPYYAFDDDYVRSKATARKTKHCRRLSWHRLFFPNCNDLHTISFGTNMDSEYVSSGSYRQVFRIDQASDEPLILKVNRFNLDFEYDKYEFIRMDALVMERLTSSPRIADIYGHCGASVLTEFLPIEIEETVVPLGYVNMTRFFELEQVQSLNTFTPTQKLDMALRMAEAIADLHGFQDGVIVHDDIQLCQYLFKADNKTMKLNDFNRAEVMLYDEDANVYCPYHNGPGGGNWRAPEEYIDGPITETIDVWSLGNNIYSLLTGLWVYPDDPQTKNLKKKMAAGEWSYLDPRYKESSLEERILAETVELIWQHDASKRPSIFDVVQFLRDAVALNN